MKAAQLVLLALAIFVTGCSTKVQTVRVDPKDLDLGGTGVNGVIYYEPVLVTVRYEYTQLLDKDKNLIATSETGGCTRILQKEEIVTLPDYNRPMAVIHKPSLFASSEFGVTLNNGLLVSVTSKSTPQIPQLLEQIIGLKDAGILSTPGQPTTPACNAGPVIAKKTRTAI